MLVPTCPRNMALKRLAETPTSRARSRMEIGAFTHHVTPESAAAAFGMACDIAHQGAGLRDPVCHGPR